MKGFSDIVSSIFFSASLTFGIEVLLNSSAGELIGGKDCNSDNAPAATVGNTLVNPVAMVSRGRSGGGVGEVSSVTGFSTTGANAD